ncbi:MAG: Mur ligase family protein [Balneolaceae bacterium]|nr:Mur ligase family protein [Balneolaceae bacterium]
MKFEPMISRMLFNDIEDVYGYLEAIPKFQSEGNKAARFNLQKFRQFCDDIGGPHREGNYVHVAGTNGKGSTCRLLASVYQKAGYKVGLYTSPHLEDFKERFVIDGCQITDQELASFFYGNERQINQSDLTYFELSTAIAFWWFNKQDVDLAIIETGLGGRLDATNIITPMVSVITSIALDHTDLLGETIEEIAAEKAGIIKQDTPVIIGHLERAAKNVIDEIATDKNAEVFRSSELAPGFDSGIYSIKDGNEEITFSPGCISPVQAYNIAMTWQVAKVLQKRFPITSASLAEGINKSAEMYPNKGRFEKLNENYDWYFDGAHNIEAVRAMKAMVQTIKPVKDTILVLSIMEDKLSSEVGKEFSEFKKIFYHTTESNRAASVDTVRQYLPDFSIMPVKKELQQKLFEEFESELVIFAGSFYFYSTVDRWVKAFATNR